LFGVSILVFVELALELELRTVPISFVVFVSILVFVELALEPESIPSHATNSYKFQSLFLWNWRSN